MIYIQSSQSLVGCFINVLLLFCLLNVSSVICVKIPNAKDYSGLEAAEIETAANSYADDESDEHFVHDLAVKLKRDFADDLVSDLFATSYGLQKVARVRKYII